MNSLLMLLAVTAARALGGLAATCAATEYPKDFPSVLSQSGAFWWVAQPDNPDPNLPAPELNQMARFFAQSPKLPMRFYLNAGTDEADLTGQGQDILLSTRHLRDVLRAKDYQVQYQELSGGHDYLSWRGTLADGLIALVGQH